ncbi:TlpA family protein disulfide reductase [Pedobacter sp. AW31-3R]|uniref:TlpA family protein disulfide reductase n=1 Tax=Pedobacter sp. AW31-3R TaxID=3445781 RepID=UPI003FA04120
MIKTIAITALSLSALLFSGYTKNSPSLNHHKALADTTLLKVGDKCPDIVFRDTTGHEGLDVKLSSLKGKYVLIDVWASWCYPCRVQRPHLLALEEKMKNKAITFVGISVDTQEWRWRGPMLKEMGGIQWMVRDKVFEKAFGINTIPRFILLDKKGNVLSLNMPMPSHPELEQELNKLKGI